jgi:hypothetical protein
MNVLIVSKADWANVGYSLERALRAAGVEAKSVKARGHAFSYPQQSEICKDPQKLKRYAERADILQFMHSVNTPLGIGDQFDGRKGIAVFHGGTAYRRGANHYNKFWQNRAQVNLIQTGDLLNIGKIKAENQIWFLPPIDTQGIQPVYRTHEKRRLIMHCPSAPGKKGTGEFNELMRRLQRDPQL